MDRKMSRLITTLPLYKRLSPLLCSLHPPPPTQPHTQLAMKCFLLTAAAAAAAIVVVTSAAASYDSPASLPAGVLSSPSFLWIAANVIVVWLVSSYRGHTAAGDGDGVGESGGGGVDVGLYTSSSGHGHDHDHDDMFAVAAVAADLVVVAAAPVVTTTVAKKKPSREARAAKRSTTDRPRARKAAASAASGETTPARPGDCSPRDVSKALAGVVLQTPRGAAAAVGAALMDTVDVKRPIIVEEEWLTWDLAATAAEATAKPDVKKSVVDEEWPDWAFFVDDDAKNPLVGEEEWSAWVLACTEEAKPAVVEKKPVVADEPWPSSWTIAATDVKMAVKKPVVVEDPWRPPPSSWTIEAPADGDKWAITLATDFSTPKPDVVAGAGAGDDDDDVSMDSMWQTILQSGRARPVTVPKSETWATTTDEQQPRRRERAAAAAVARREIRKSATATNMTPPPSPPHVRAPPAPARRPWRTRDVLPAMPNDELMRRAESLIRRHHEQLRLQRQESEQRQALELQRRRPLIRV
nr:uncharacterized protein LOC4348959 [Oryza sativa Japonica Group]